ncbi:MAG: hypothetical protein QXJ68_01605 [Methanocellales archaeon]
MLNSREAVSEVVGYMLIFTIVVLSIGLMYVYGYPILEDLQNRIRFQNAEQGFATLQADLDRVVFDQAPIKTTRINTGGGSIQAASSGDRINIVVNISGEKKYEVTRELGIVEYRHLGKRIAYIDGGVFIKEGERSYLRIPPKIYVYNDTETSNLTVIISIFSIYCKYPTMGGGERVSVLSKFNRSSTSAYINQSFNSSLSNVTIVINSSLYADAWEMHFSNLKERAYVGIEVTRLNSTHVRAVIPFNRVVIAENKADVEVFSS